MASSSPSLILQAAAAPIFSGHICLVNSKRSNGWVIPKGHIETGDTPQETALQEAWEEAGLKGSLHDEPLGSYEYHKNGARYQVIVFLMEVAEVAAVWPEDDRRVRCWVPTDQVDQFVQVPAIRGLLRGTANRLKQLTAPSPV
jgi:8-oxo-dGTP pyrophosphatase MutT (NUDIX family)